MQTAESGGGSGSGHSPSSGERTLPTHSSAGLGLAPWWYSHAVLDKCAVSEIWLTQQAVRHGGERWERYSASLHYAFCWFYLAQ